MKANAAFFLLTAVVAVFSGCATFLAPETGDREAAFVVGKGEAEISVSGGRMAGEVVRAIEYALSLEKVVWDERERIRSRADVLGVFRRGFGTKKAEEITDWVWIDAVDREGNTIEMLNPGEPVLAVPDKIEILEYEEFTATALLTYGEKKSGPVVWKGHTIVAIMEHEDGTWKIYDTHVSIQ